MTSDKRPAEYSICEIFRGNQAVGLGFAIAPARVVTCAHVVNAALGRPDIRDPVQPGERERVLVRFSIGGNVHGERYLDASVSGWLPAEDGVFDIDDVAVLDLAQAAPAHVRPLRLVPHRPSMPVQMWGPQPGRPDGGHVVGQLLGQVRGGRVQVSVNGHGPFKVRPGFSGGPVWEPETGDAVGVLAACGMEDNATDAYLLRTDQIRAAEDCRQASPPLVPATQVDQPRHRAPHRSGTNRRARVTLLAAGLAVVVAALSAAVLLPGSDHATSNHAADPRADSSPASTTRATPRPAKTKPRPQPSHSPGVSAAPVTSAAAPATTASAPPPPQDPVPSVAVTSDPNAGPNDPNEISGSEVDAYLDHCDAWLDKDGSGDVTGVLYPVIESCSAELIRSGGPSVTFPASSNSEATTPVPAVGHTVKICAWLNSDKSDTLECSPAISR